jgi:hypothetical protein
MAALTSGTPADNESMYAELVALFSKFAR